MQKSFKRRSIPTSTRWSTSGTVQLFSTTPAISRPKQFLSLPSWHSSWQAFRDTLRITNFWVDFTERRVPPVERLFVLKMALSLLSLQTVCLSSKWKSATSWVKTILSISSLQYLQVAAASSRAVIDRSGFAAGQASTGSFRLLLKDLAKKKTSKASLPLIDSQACFTELTSSSGSGQH